MCLRERDWLHLLFAEDACMILFRWRNAAHDYLRAALGLNFAILRSVGGGELTVAHAYSLWFERKKTKLRVGIRFY